MDEYLSVLVPLLNGENAAFTGETVTGNIGLSVQNEGACPCCSPRSGRRC